MLVINCFNKVYKHIQIIQYKNNNMTNKLKYKYNKEQKIYNKHKKQMIY